MRTTFWAAAVAAAVLCAPRPAQAWGFAGHRLIMTRALELLPSELKPFFTRFRDEVIVRVIDPDLWRNVGWEEDPNHFMDFGMPELGEYPFSQLPRERDRALEKFGVRTMDRVGYLPWRQAEMFGNLRRAFEGFARQGPYTTGDVTLFAPVLSHYVQDSHQPFHATNNFDGQLSGNAGIHSRFERDLIEKFGSRLTLAPAAPAPMLNARDAAFEVLLDSHRQVKAILDADSQAIAGKDVYDDEYFEQFFARTRPILERQLNRAITATAAAIIGAWQAAGKPIPRTTDPRPIQKVKK